MGHLGSVCPGSRVRELTGAAVRRTHFGVEAGQGASEWAVMTAQPGPGWWAVGGGGGAKAVLRVKRPRGPPAALGPCAQRCPQLHPDVWAPKSQSGGQHRQEGVFWKGGYLV